MLAVPWASFFLAGQSSKESVSLTRILPATGIPAAITWNSLERIQAVCNDISHWLAFSLLSWEMGIIQLKCPHLEEAFPGRPVGSMVSITAPCFIIF